MLLSYEVFGLILTVITMIAGGVVWVLGWRGKQAQTWASTVHDMAATVGELSESLDSERRKRRALEDDLQRVHEDLSRILVHVDDYRRGVRILLEQLQSMGVEPDWKPSD